MKTMGWRVTAVGVLLVGISGCGASLGGAATVAPIAADSGHAEAILNQLRDEIDGTPSQRDAGARLLWDRKQSALAGCMRSAGFVYQPSPYAGLASNSNGTITVGGILATAPISDTGWGASNDFLQSLRATRGLAPAPRLGTGSQPAVAGAATRCLTTAQPLSGSAFPSGYDVLEGAIGDVLGRAAAAPDVVEGMAAYTRCMAAAGYSFESIDDLTALVNDQLTRVPAHVADPASSPAFRSAVVFERALATSDRWCRENVRSRALAGALPGLLAFMSKYKVQLAKIESDWTAIQRQAAESTR
jgi:hypothetical protein